MSSRTKVVGTLVPATFCIAVVLYTTINQESQRRTHVDQGVYCPPPTQHHQACCPLYIELPQQTISIHCQLPLQSHRLFSRTVLHTTMPPQPPSAADLELAAQFCPVVIFDSKEEIRPMRMQDYVAQSSIHDLKTDTVLQHNTHPAIDAQLATRSDVYLHLNHADWRRMDAEDVNDVPFYVKIDRDVMHQGQNCISIVYMFFYPHDYGGLEMHGKRYGEHVADLEHVRILITATAPHTIVRMHFAAHGFFEGRWVDPSSLSYYDEPTRNRPLIYVACNGHASYPKPGKYVRLFGIAPDKTDGKGRRWNAHALVEGYPDILLDYRGKLSREILNGPCQEWWHEVEPEVTQVCRFTGGFVNVFAKRNGRATQ